MSDENEQKFRNLENKNNQNRTKQEQQQQQNKNKTPRISDLDAQKMNQDIEMLNTADLSSQYMSQQHQQQQQQQQQQYHHQQQQQQPHSHSFNVPTPVLGDQLNGAYTNSPHLGVPNQNNENNHGNMDEIADGISEDEDLTNNNINRNPNNDENEDDAENEEDDEDEEEDDEEINALFHSVDGDTKTPGEILDEFSQKLEDINTTLPDSVINYYMRKSGFIVNDPKLIKIISIASQKFISEIVNDVWQRQRLKTKQGATQATTQAPSAPSTSASAASGAGSGGSTANVATTSSATEQQTKQQKAAASSATAAALAASLSAANTAQLTLDDLTQVLADYGINVKKPYYFI